MSVLLINNEKKAESITSKLAWTPHV